MSRLSPGLGHSIKNKKVCYKRNNKIVIKILVINQKAHAFNSIN